MTIASKERKRQAKPLPEPSYAPASMAVGVTFVAWGAVTSWIFSAVGLVVVGIASFRWVQDLRHVPASALKERPETLESARAPATTLKSQVESGLPAHSPGPGLHRYAMLLAACTLVLLIVGALVTSYGGEKSAVLQGVHRAGAGAVGILAIGLGIWLSRSEPRPGVRRLGWIVVAGVIAQAALGTWNPTVGVFHALLAQLFFALTVAVAVVTSPDWTRGPEPADDPSRVSLRNLSMAAVVLAVLQVALGSAVRHREMGVTPHIIGALVVTIVVLLLGVLVTHQFPEHRTLRPIAKVLIGITFAQVMLGMAAFITRLMAEEASLAVVIPSVAHVMTGSLTLAATVALTLQIRRHVRAAVAAAKQKV